MNRYAYLTTGLAIKTFSALSKAKVNIYGKENIPNYGGGIFAINHFTRLETILLPYYLYHVHNIPVWSLADSNLFKGSLASFFDNVGVVSTKHPDRDLLIVKSLLTGEAVWVIFPEGRMVKSKKILEKGNFIVPYAGGKHRPHTGIATLALRTEFYRERFRYLLKENKDEALRLIDLFKIDNIESMFSLNTYIVPVNITYYPIRAKENMISNLAMRLMEDPSPRVIEELMAEGTMLLSGVDMDVRFGKPMAIRNYLKHPVILNDIKSLHKIDFDDPIPSKEAMRTAAGKIMEKYMANIYSMTTVNHDHLFASILRMIPFKKIDKNDLKLRVYMASCLDFKKMGINTHKSLNKSQINLLTDDRTNKYRDFISVALEKGLVKKKGNIIIKDKLKILSAFGFHRMRIENPIAVMANEIEPLAPLQNALRLISWMPSFWLKRKIVHKLIKKGMDDFDHDYNKFYINGESKEKEVGRPILLHGKTNKIGILLIHGYMAAPLEVKELATYLWKKGFWVYAPRLSGHGTSPDDLAQKSYIDWINSVDEGYAILSNICNNVVVGGFSTGAGLALDLAARVKNVASVFAVSPPLKLHNKGSKLVPAVDIWNKL
ncbi:MAG: alpha/beta fold hydrolase, partial [Desulfobacterales bacterium]|nr:alpha/beta fold hydrolase [Desulfobacterales bacterium]